MTISRQTPPLIKALNTILAPARFAVPGFGGTVPALAGIPFPDQATGAGLYRPGPPGITLPIRFAASENGAA